MPYYSDDFLNGYFGGTVEEVGLFGERGTEDQQKTKAEKAQAKSSKPKAKQGKKKKSKGKQAKGRK